MTSKSKKKTQPELIEFRHISSIAEYRLYDDPFNAFGLESSNKDQCWSAWKALTGSVMLTLTPSELRSLANAIEHK
jgi:hypothetical protein